MTNKIIKSIILFVFFIFIYTAVVKFMEFLCHLDLLTLNNKRWYFQNSSQDSCFQNPNQEWD